MSTTTTASPLTEAEQDGTEAPPRSRLRTVAILLAVLAVAGAACWWLFLRGGEDELADGPQEGIVVEVAQMTVNLAGHDLHYARFAFALVLAEDVLPADVEPRFALLRDAALSVVQAFDQAELRTPEGTARLRDQLTARAHEVYPDGGVVRVVLTELLVQ